MRTLLMLLALGSAPPGDLRLIEELNECMNARFQDPSPNALGMSRVMLPPSMGTHYQPYVTRDRDFRPENARETKALAGLEEQKLQVGFYLFGREISQSKSELLNYRALKGPGAVTIGTPRASWYPGYPGASAEADKMEAADGLPDWKAIYSLAQRAMKSFADGGQGFETTSGTWQVAARPLLAESERCLACHSGTTVLHHAIGGVLYAYRRTGA